MFTACGDDTSVDSSTIDDNITVSTTEAYSEDCSITFFDTTVSDTLNACISCHSDGGVAQTSKFVLNDPLTNNKDLNYEILKAYIEEYGIKIIEKGTNEVAHIGGVQLSGSSLVSMQTFVDYIDGTQECSTPETIASIASSSILLLSPEKTLRNASYKLQSKAPTVEEINEATTTDNLDTILDTYMQSDVFYDWLRQNFNDFLLTDFYSPSRDAIALLSGTDFPNRTWYNDENSAINEYQLDDYTNYAIAREPIELMIHVIKEDKPFSEILTADYVMVNPFSARTYSINIPDFTYIHDVNRTRDEIEVMYPRDVYKEATISGIPHAGLLTTITFLNRFPSTDTNIDRHRSAKIQLFFLDTDILGLANRPINSSESVSDTATWTNPNCTVCHNVMEPIASTFKNWTNTGRYQPGFRGDAVQIAGLSLNNTAPASESDTLLQWIAKEIVKDDRFAMASVKIFFKAILGRDVLKEPIADEVDYTDKLQAYNYENEILIDIKEIFLDNDMNAKVIIKELIKSPLFRATASTSGNDILSQNLGQAHLITPEELNRKIYDVMGYYWNRYSTQSDSNNENFANHRLLRDDHYNILYGGMNSGSVSSRVDSLNGVMANIQLRMALQMSCYPVSRDFYFEASQRKLFPYVSPTLEPENEFFIAAIKKNIQYLHKHILGEDLSDDDLELEKTYQLFLDTYNEGKVLVQNSVESQYLMNECDVYYNPITWDYLTGDTAYKRIATDPNYVVRSWQAVVAYLLSDFKFVYENSSE